jgi:hypothetical protein
VTFDTRVQSARRPSAFSATVAAVTPDSVTVEPDDRLLGTLTLSVDVDTYIRVRDPGVREDFTGFAEYTKPGMHIVVVRVGDRAAMLRKGTHP